MIEVNNNMIILDNGRKLEFDNQIMEAVEWYGKLVIVFNTNDDEGYDNVFCYTTEKQLLWRIKPAPVDIGGTVRSPYVGVDIIYNKCRVIDFFGRRFVINIENGAIVSKDIVW